MKLLSVKLSTIILLFLSFSFNSIGADTYTLEYKLEKGKTYNQNLVSVSKMEVMGMNMGIIQEMGIKYDVLEQNNDAFDIRTTYKRIKTNMSGPTSFVIDSDSPEKSTDKSIGEVFKSLMEIPIDIQLTKQGKITSVKGSDKMVEKVNSLSNEQVKQLLSQQFSEKAIKASYEQMTILFPAKPVAIGESWDITKNMNSSGVDIISKMKLTLKEVKDNIATLDCTGTLATPEGGGVLSVQGMEAKVSVKGEQTGTILIDMKTGWIIKSETTQKIIQDIEVMGQAMKQNVETNITVTAD